MHELKAAVIGTGGAARLHMESYAKSEKVFPVAVVSRSGERAREVAAQFGVEAYTDVETMLERERPDVVSVATLEWEHEDPVVSALQAGAHVLCEKVMAHTLAAGERMVAMAARTGRTLGVNYNYRSVPSHELIREELRRGGFGRPALFTAQMHAYLWPHLLDLMRFFFGDPVEVTAAMVDEQALRPPVSAGPQGRPWEYAADSEMLYQPSMAVGAQFRYAQPDFLVSMSGSALVPLEQNFWSFALYGTEDAVCVERATRANLNGEARLGRLAERIAAMPECSYAESFALSVGKFVEAVRAGRPAPVTGEDGLAVMRLDAAMVQAARSGRAVKLSV